MAAPPEQDWSDWIGRSETRTDRIDPGLLVRWCATLDRDLPAGPDVPQGLHWCLAVPDAPTAALGEDGHPRRDAGSAGLLPPIPLPRRMWAGSSVEFLAPLPAGAQIERASSLRSIQRKTGGSGTLVFVEVAHDTRADGVVAVREVQSIVYREAAPAGAPPVPSPAAADAEFDPAPWPIVRTIVPGEALLFRYSALTFNSHRIHYDLPYATAIEGYRGLVVHGPLTATLLLDLARQVFGDNALRRFRFRGLSPAICGEPLHLALRDKGEAIDLAAFAADGRQIMQADATR